MAAYASQPSVDLLGGLWLDDYMGAFLAAGGRASSFFQYFPEHLGPECDATAGGFTMFTADAAHHVAQPLSQYFAAQLLTQEWVQPGHEVHRVFPASSEAKDAQGRTVVTAYTVERPDGLWSVLLVNKDPKEGHAVRVAFRDSAGEKAFAGDVAIATFGAAEYVWHPAEGRADPDGPISRATRAAGDGVFVVPKASATVLRGAVH